MPGRLLLTFTLAGEGIYACDGVELVARRGDMVLMQDDSPTTHEVRVGEPWQHANLVFNPPRRLMIPPVFDQVGPGLHRAHISLEPTRQRVQDAFARVAADLGRRDTALALHELTESTAPFVSEPIREPLRRLLLHIVEEILLLATQDQSNDAVFDPRIAVALEAMGSDPARRHTVQSLAALVNMSPSRFAHLFTGQVGKSPMHTLRLVRLQYATRLLQCTSDPIGAIATASGFNTSSDLSRQFRRQRGMSPSEYRAQWR
jgi:AraC family transcriptional regulator of arabinose operon